MTGTRGMITFAANSRTMAHGKFTFTFNFDETLSLMLDSVEHHVEEIAEGFTPFHFLRGDWREVNMKMEGVEAPFLVLFEPRTGTLSNRLQWTHDGVRLQIGFFDIVNREAYAEDNMAVQQAMRACGAVFLKALGASGYFEPVADAPYTFYSELFTCHASGVVFELTLRTAAGVCVPTVVNNEAL